MPMTGRRFLLPLTAFAAAIAVAILISGPHAHGQAGGYPAPGPDRENPCVGQLARVLHCPDLKMAAPREMYVTYHRNGAVLLHATNNIKSRGEGPIWVKGKRISKRQMKVRQLIRTRNGGKRSYATNGRLVFYFIPGQGRYWKYHQAARFELWSIRGNGKLGSRIRTGPKLTYCLRDLERTKPSRRSPRNMVFPGCSQNPRAKYRVLGTSVGWSDIYPATYHENYINVRGLRGCFVFMHRADPRNDLFENNERNNTGKVRIKLPPRGGKIQKCSRR